MKLHLIVFQIMVVSSLTLAQQLAPLGKMLDKYYPAMPEGEDVPVWVYFRDKGPTAEQQLSLAPQTFLSERAIERRRKVLPGRVIDAADIPLERSYVQSVASIVKKVRHEVKWFNAVSVVATKRQIEELRSLPFVSEVELVARFRQPREPEQEPTQPPPQPAPGQPTLLNYGNSFTQNNQINTVAVHNLGISGSGVLIGIFDAGFSNLTHPALVTRPILARYDFVTNSTTLGSHSHGQNTFSVIGGFADGFLIGPAYGASFVLARTEDATPETPIEEDNWARAIIWADSIGIDVASTSLGYTGYDPPWPGYTWQDMNGMTTVITRAADRAVEMGIVVVNSAGNGYTTPLPANTLGAPSDGFNVLAAGAVTSSGIRASFSSVGPSADGRIKPDVMAMGQGVTGASGATGYTNSLSGTSFSCPLTGGVAALVVSANPNVSPLQVREAMRQTSNRVNNPDREYGWGILDALKAVNYAWIEHIPLLDTEDTTARTVVVTIKSRVPLITDSTRIVYGINAIFTGSALLTPTISPDVYSAEIPYLASGVPVTYYIAAKNQHVSTRSPLNAPAQYYSYQVGTDTEAPSITHSLLGNQSILSWPALVSASVSDESGIDSVTVEYFLNGLQQPTFVLTSMSNDTYADTFHLSRAQVNPGDSIDYRVIAVDRSSRHNVSIVPSSGYVRFAIVNNVNIAENFDSSNGGFTGTNDWQWGQPSGTSPPPHSPSRCWGTIIAGNYMVGPRLSSLTTPTYSVFSNRSSFSFWQWYQIQSRFDGANVKVSVNGGPFQIVHPVGGYPTASIYNGFGNPLASQPGFSNVGGTWWQKVTFDLTGIAIEGNTIAVRFDFGADNSIQYPGWYIDDFAFGTAMPSLPGPQLVFPLHGTNQPTALTLQWNPVPTAAAYRLQIATEPTFRTGFVTTLTDTQYAVDSLLNNTSYYWRVGTIDEIGDTTYSPAWSFTTFVVPTIVNLISPEHGATVTTDTVKCVWSRSISAVFAYWFERATDSLFSVGRVVDSTLTDTSKVTRELALIRNTTHWWRVRARNPAGWGEFSIARSFSVTIVGVEGEAGFATVFNLSQNHPNPFNPQTTIEYAIPVKGRVRLSIFDLVGREISTLVDAEQAAGAHRAVWDAGSFSSGVYFYRLKAGTYVETKKLMLLR